MKKLSKLAYIIMPFVWAFVLGVSLIEVYYYSGFILKHFYIDSIVIYLIFGLVGVFSLNYRQNKPPPIRSLFVKINYISIYFFGFLFYFLYIVEKIKYTNYIFSTFHINPGLVSVPLGLSIFAYIISSKETLSMFQSSPKRLIGWFPVVAILLWIFIPNITEIILSSVQDATFIIRSPKASYDQKMEHKVGKQFYRYVQFVKNNTPENSKILLPPFPAYPWPQSGNIPYMTYFLHPRELFNGDEYSPKHDLKAEGFDYVLVIWGELSATSGGFTHGWPKFNVSATDVIYIVEGVIQNQPGNYVYEKVKGIEKWGIIKIKK